MLATDRTSDSLQWTFRLSRTIRHDRVWVSRDRVMDMPDEIKLRSSVANRRRDYLS